MRVEKKLHRAGYYDPNNPKSPWYLWEPPYPYGPR